LSSCASRRAVGIEVRERLVEQRNRGSARRARERGPLLLAAGQPALPDAPESHQIDNRSARRTPSAISALE